MAYTDDYVKTNWVNYPSTNTPLNQTNLNHAEGGIKTNCGRIANLDTTKANQSDLLLTVKNVSFDSTTGTFTFTLWNNTTITVNTDIEKVAVNFTYDDDPASPHYQNLVLELSDGTYKYIDMSALITQYEFTNTSTIAFTVGVGGEITANVVDGSITANKLQPNYLADCQAAQTGAQNAKTAADADALKAEGFANGTQNGTPVASGSPYYENNAKYWKEQAQAIASQSLAGLTDVDITTPSAGDVLTYNSTDSEWENEHTAPVTVTNNPISITTKSKQVARDTKITLSPIQASGTPTPSNPLPISGYDSVELRACGVNQWDEEWELGRYDTADGTKYSSIIFIRNKYPIAVEPSTTYFFKSTVNEVVLYYEEDGSYISYEDVNNNDTFTTPANCKYICFYMSSDYGTPYNHDISINYPSTDTSYHAYEGQTITHTLPETVYGGEHDVETGVLEVTEKMDDLGDLAWNALDADGGYYTDSLVPTAKNTQNALCTAYKNAGSSLANLVDLSFVGDNNGRIYLRDRSYADATSLTIGLTGVKFVCERETPVEIDLTPRIVNLLQGANVVTSNGTSVTLTYREGTIATLADIPSETVNKLADMVADVQGDISTLDSTKTDLSAIAPIENGATASQAYKVNEYFIRGGKLCKCISAISVGSSFTLNTNYAETTIANEIPKYTVSTTDITAGTTPLASGQFYIYRS